MLNTFGAIFRNGKIEPLENIQISEGSKILITLLPPEEEEEFWVKSSQSSLDLIWNNSEDDVYEELLKK